MLKAGLEYQIHGQFHEWRDPITSRVYGLHFPEQEDAAMFLKTINSILNRLTNPVSYILEIVRKNQFNIFLLLRLYYNWLVASNGLQDAYFIIFRTSKLDTPGSLILVSTHTQT